MIKSGAAAAAATTGGRNESSSSIRSGKGSGKGKITEGLKERDNTEITGSYVSSKRRHGTQLSTSDKPLRSSSGESVNVVSKLGRPPKTPGLFSNIEVESSPVNEGEGMEGFSIGSKCWKGSKRSRIGNDDLLSDNEEIEIEKKYGLEELLQQLDNQIEDVYKKGERGRTNYNKLVTLDIFRKVNLEVIRRDAELINLKDKLLDVQDEKIALQRQIIELQSMNTNVDNSREVGKSYLDAVLKGRTKDVVEGRQLPITTVPDIVQHIPAEKILIYKAEVKGGMVTRAKQEEFRCDLKVTLGDELMGEVSAVRPTRYGGHTIIFSSEEGRERALRVIKNNEVERGIEERNSCIIAPKKKKTKFVCRECPGDISPEEILKEMYEKYNPLLQSTPEECREAKIFITRLGWILEVSVIEAIAIYSQNGRIRFGIGRELKIEEFIPLQQCYKCCNFRHNANECRMEAEWCRLCGRKGYSGKVYPFKNEKDKWRCANCIWKNENKGMKLDVKHGAAQLHKCAVTMQQKEIRKIQLASSGVVTSPVDVRKRDLDLNREREEGGQASVEGRRVGYGVNMRRKTRSKSIKRQMNMNQNIPYGMIGSSISSSSSLRQLVGNVSNVIISSQSGNRVIRPMLTHNWQTVGRHSEGSNVIETGDVIRRDREFQRSGINSSQSELNFATDIVMENPSHNIAYYQHG